MSDEAAAHHLLTVLEERDLVVSLDDILLSFESEETKEEAESWVHEYLDSCTLLSRDELELYEQLSSAGQLKNLETEASKILPHQDEDLSAAVASLQTSTAAIEEHVKLLHTQKLALEELQALNKPNLNVEHMRNDRRRREHQEKTRLEVAMEELSDSISSHLSSASQDAKTEHGSLLSYTSERLASDDRMLAALPNIVSNITTVPQVTNDAKSIDQWCNAIVSFRAAEIKARVDATYQRNIANGSASELPRGSEEELQAEKEALKEELETLHSEIAAIAEMVVEHELREPIIKTKALAQDQTRQSRRAWLTYVLSTLDFMTSRLETINTHAIDLSGFLAALDSISSVFSSELAMPSIDTVSKPSKRQSMALKSLLSPPVKLRSIDPLELSPVLRDVLRHANITISRGESADGILGAVEAAQAERQEKLNRHHSSAGLSLSRYLGEALEKIGSEAQALRDKLHVNTRYKSVSFTDQSLDGRLKALGVRLEMVDVGVANAESEELSMGEKRVSAFVENWVQ